MVVEAGEAEGQVPRELATKGPVPTRLGVLETTCLVQPVQRVTQPVQRVTQPVQRVILADFAATLARRHPLSVAAAAEVVVEALRAQMGLMRAFLKGLRPHRPQPIRSRLVHCSQLSV